MHIREHVRPFLKPLAPLFQLFRNNRIVMFHAGRSGSSVLGFMLHGHPQIFWAGEILKKEKVVIYKQTKTTFDHREIIRTDEHRAFCKWYGFEMKFEHMRDLGVSKEQFLAELDRLRYSNFIVLTRKNYLRRITSGAVAQVTGRWHVGHRRTSQLTQVTLDPAEIIPAFNLYQNDIAEIQVLLKGKKCLYLTYEDDVENDPAIAYNKICAFMQLSQVKVLPKLKRINPYPLSEMIINFDEVVVTLKGTPFEWMLELS